MKVLTGRAVGGPRAGIKLTAQDDWNGLVSVQGKVCDGRYKWVAWSPEAGKRLSTWVWFAGEAKPVIPTPAKRMPFFERGKVARSVLRR